MGYDFDKQEGLNFRKGRRAPIRSFTPKGKPLYYYHKTRRGFGYVSTPPLLENETDNCLCQDHSSGTSSWESDVSIRTLFKNMSVMLALMF